MLVLTGIPAYFRKKKEKRIYRAEAKYVSRYTYSDDLAQKIMPI